MTDKLTIALAQLTASVGDLACNADAILAARAQAGGADLVVTPEMSIVGYPPEDLVLKPALIAGARAQVERLAAATADGGPALLVGAPWAEDGKLYNVVALLDGGRIAGITRKHDLPNYGTFDEKRLFSSGPLPGPLDIRGVRIGVPICEDVWFPDVCECLAETGAELLIAPHGSPFEVGKDDHRLSVAVSRVTETGLPLAFLNRVGGQDELVFDGASFVLNADRTLAHRLPDWDEDVRLTQWQRGPQGWSCASGNISPPDADPADIYHAMLVGLRDYVNRNRFPGVHWVTPKLYVRIEEAYGEPCAYFREAPVKTTPDPDKVDDVMDASKLQLREAWFSVKTGLPVAFKSGESTGRFSFEPAQSDPVIPPANVREKISEFARYEAYLKQRAAPEGAKGGK